MINDNNKLLKLFIDEVETHLAAARAALLDFLETPEDENNLQRIIRSFHTIKGSAGIIGYNEFSEYLHKAESFFYSMKNGINESNKLKSIGIIESLDELIKHFPDDFEKYFERLKKLLDEQTEIEEKQPTDEHHKNNTQEKILYTAKTPPKSEKIISRTAPSHTNGEIDRLKYAYNDLLSLGGQITQHFDKQLQKEYTAKIAEIGDRIKNLSLIPFSSLSDKMKNIVIYTSSKCKKKVEINIDCNDVKMDKHVLSKVEETIVHLLRNAVYHGIEYPNERTKKGKNEYGLINIICEQKGNRIIIDIEDDGKGIDLEKVYQKARENGLTDKEYNAITQEEIIEFIYTTGFSTADTADEISGRGIGMDIVKKNITDIGGFFNIKTEKDKGTSFSLNIPSSLETIHSLIIKTEYDEVAIPIDMVNRIIKINQYEITKDSSDSYKLIVNNTPHDIIYLSQIYRRITNSKIENMAIIIKGFDLAFGFQSYVGDRVLSTMPIKGPITKIDGILGISITEEGKPIAIINPISFINSTDFKKRNKLYLQNTSGQNSASATGRKHILVIDDNKVVREMYKGILESNNYKVSLAKNGIEGLEIYKRQNPDMLISDIEMPEMDGLEMLKHIRVKDEKIPVILLSSKGEDKDIKNGMQAGANAYLVKRYFTKDKFLEKIREFI
jgi:chemotaxis protein histidine kinase CheA/CheY-like chemotaxis protein